MSGIWLWSYLVLWTVVLILTLVMFALMRQVGLLHLRIGATGARMGNSGPELGEQAPKFEAFDLNSETMLTPEMLTGKSTLLVFISPGCNACDGLMPGIIALQRHEHKETTIILVSDVEDESLNREYIVQHQLERIPYIMKTSLAEAYRVGGPPYAVLIDAEGIVLTKGLVNHLEHLESLLNARDAGFPSVDSKLKVNVEAADVKFIRT